jgi:hypothetical protein
MILKSYHLLKLLFRLLLADISVMDGVGFDEHELMLLNSPFSFGFWSILVFSFGGFSIYFGKGLRNPLWPVFIGLDILKGTS